MLFCFVRFVLFYIVEVFEGFLKAYIEEFKYKSITTDDWKNFLYQHFSDKVIKCLLFKEG